MRQLSDAEFTLFCMVGAPRELACGETIFRKGEHGRSMFVIESGEIDLEFGDGLANKRLGAREFLGELALFIGNHARVASATAAAPSSLRVIDQVAFESVLKKEPLLLAQFMRRSFAYLVASEQQLIIYLKRRNEDLISTLHSLRQTQTQLSTASNLVCTDELTGLSNRRGLYQFLAGARRAPGTRLALFLVDVDRFKKINDEHGHLVGDHALSLVARELRSCVGPTDLCCRLGGDEFAVLVQLPHREDPVNHAAEIVAAVRARRLPAPYEALSISVSVGASLCDENTDWSTWYGIADRALYAAKGDGGDGWRLGF
ncbi:MAG: GGDEF domain-containing protein [Rudaea sp.]